MMSKGRVPLQRPMSHRTARPTATVPCRSMPLIGAGAIGAGSWQLGVLGMVVVGIAAALLRWFPRQPPAHAKVWTLHLRVGAGLGDQSPWEAIFAKHLLSFDLDSTATARQGAAVDLTFLVQLTSSPHDFLRDLNRLEGIQGVELKSK